MSSEEREVQDLPAQVLDLLFVQWVYNLAKVDLGVTQYGSSDNEWIFSKQPEGFAFRLRNSETLPRWNIDIEGFDEQLVNSIVERAYEAVARRDTGGTVHYVSELISPKPAINDQFAAQFLRILGDRTIISGWRRLADQVLLEFESDPPTGEPQLFAPRTIIRVHLFVPGGGPGPLSSRMARNMLEFVRAICTFAMGRVVDAPLALPSLARNERGRQAEELRFDYQNVLTLARNSIPLDPYGLMTIGDIQSVSRYHSALISFDAALRQSNADVATILFVSGIEAIVSPDAPWRKTRLVSRFIRSVLDYAPATVDSLINHMNVEQALGFRLRGGLNRRRRKILERVYELRSVPVHGGISMALGLMDSENASLQLRVALLSDLYQGVVLGFLQSPRSSLVGHPSICPGDAAAE